MTIEIIENEICTKKSSNGFQVRNQDVWYNKGTAKDTFFSFAILEAGDFIERAVAEVREDGDRIVRFVTFLEVRKK